MDEIKMHNKYQLLMTTILVVVALAGVSMHFITDSVEKPEVAVAQIEKYPNPFNDIELQAKAAVVYDVTTGTVLYEKNADMPLPLASLTKVMTALVAAEHADKNKTVAITERALAQNGEYGLNSGERWKLKDLLDFMLVESSNDGAAAVADAVINLNGNSFIEQMNEEAQKLQLTHTKFLNETGLDENIYLPGAYGSARDMGKLMTYVLTTHPHLLEATRYDQINVSSLDGTAYIVQNTNNANGHIPQLLASKTGYTDLAGGNLLVAFDAGLNRPVIIAVLGSTQEGRFNDITMLASTTLGYINVALK
jgi:serine-type D-Ala-D-Ala carboxypeptidase (penicillin-binding protein 5/6)